MNKLPSRNDEIYEEIESFEDYEFTNCIAYEMYCRNEYNKNEINNTVTEIRDIHIRIWEIDERLFNFETESTFEISETEVLKLINEKKTIRNSIEKTFLKIGVDFNNTTHIEYVSALPCLLEKNCRFLDNFVFNKYEYEDNIKKFILENFKKEFQIKEKIQLEDFLSYKYPRNMNWEEDDNFEEDNFGNTIANGYEVKVSTIIDGSMIPNQYNKKDKILLFRESPEILVNLGCFKTKSEIKHSFKRPNIPITAHKKVNLELNLSLPKRELLAYITRIKDDFDEYSGITIETPLEQLGEVFEKSDSKISKKSIADKFFVYDYITARQEQIREENKEIENEYNVKIKRIKNNPYLNYSDVEIQIKEIKKELNENIVNTKVTNLCEELSSIVPNVKSYYYQIKPFIDDFKYEELITGESS